MVVSFNLTVYLRLLTLVEFILFLAITSYGLYYSGIHLITLSGLMENSKVITIILAGVLQLRYANVVITTIIEPNKYKKIILTCLKSIYLSSAFIVTYIPYSTSKDIHIIFASITFVTLIVVTLLEHPYIAPFQILFVCIFFFFDDGVFAEYLFIFVEILRQMIVKEDCSVILEKRLNRKEYIPVAASV